ncbi:MAG: glycoside hydrolase family 16 protein [Chitinophagaceae bacterium]
MLSKIFPCLVCILLSEQLPAQKPDAFKPDYIPPVTRPGFTLVWHDEFNNAGNPDSANWAYENGFARNKELQWYQPQNANCAGGLLVITGRRERIKNNRFDASGNDWRLKREYAEYTSASLQTRGRHQWQFGRFEIRARIDTAMGAWPAIWTLGAKGRWPSNGEVDIMEFYRVKSVPTILANVAWGTEKPNVARWDNSLVPLSDFMEKDREWSKKFHTWRMDWTSDSINIYLDDAILNTTTFNQVLNPDGTNPFLQPHYFLLNLAIGANGGDPAHTVFPIKYEIDYVRVYQKKK